MLDMRDPLKRELANRVARLFAAVDDVTRMPQEPEPDVAMANLAAMEPALRELRLFIADDWEAQADLSEADLGSLVLEALMCTCPIKVDRGSGHDEDCTMRDSAESASERA